MKTLATKIILLLLLLIPAMASTQNTDLNLLSYEEYLAYVKQQHPLVKQSALRISQSEAKLLKMRGALDPTLSFNYDDKTFKSSNYWNKFSTTFTVPTIFGVDFKANYQNNSGDYINPEFTVPDEGLYSAGVSIDLARGFLMNQRMATVRIEQNNIEQTKALQTLEVNKIIYEASIAYMDWLRFYKEEGIYLDYMNNAKKRLNGVIRSVELGDKQAIDITEAKIIFKTTQLNLEKVRLNKIKAKLKASNYLWYEAIPLEISDSIQPVSVTKEQLINILNLEEIIAENTVDKSHPKLKSLEFKGKSLELDLKLKKNLMLPKLQLEYNFLTSTESPYNSFNSSQYKAFVNLKVPIFMRKQRADLKIAKYKVQDLELERFQTKLTLENKFNSTYRQLESYETQAILLDEMVADYRLLLSGEELKFQIGESSLFLVNTREQKLVETRIKENKLAIDYLELILLLFNVSGNV